MLKVQVREHETMRKRSRALGHSRQEIKANTEHWRSGIMKGPTEGDLPARTLLQGGGRWSRTR